MYYHVCLRLLFVMHDIIYFLIKTIITELHNADECRRGSLISDKLHGEGKDMCVNYSPQALKTVRTVVPVGQGSEVTSVDPWLWPLNLVRV